MSVVTKPMMLDSTGQNIVDALLSISGAINGKGHIYGFHIDGTESDPDKKVTYLKDAVGMTPMAMNFDTGVMNYGSWKNVLDEWLMPKPCMVYSDGTVYKYLNENDYTKYVDGTASDVANTNFDGNAMVEWGKNGKKIWWKIEPSADGKSADVYVADYQADANFHAWSFIDKNGDMKDHFYSAIYDGSNVSNKVRSISGLTPIMTLTAANEIAYSQANGSRWYTETFADVIMINILLVLLGKSTSTQTVFGSGNVSSYTSDDAPGTILSGTMNTKGMFWGSNVSSKTEIYGVKTFGMENWWGNVNRRYAGHINDNGKHKIKLTFGKEDGSTVDGFNLTGDGYIEVGNTPSASGYISEMLFTPFGFFPSVLSSSSSTHYCDYMWVNDARVNYALHGGDSGGGVGAGAFCIVLSDSAGSAWWYRGACLSLR